VTGTKFYTLPIALESAAHHGQHEKVSSKFLHTQHKHKSLTWPPQAKRERILLCRYRNYWGQEWNIIYSLTPCAYSVE